jgi:hypothetical protein
MSGRSPIDSLLRLAPVSDGEAAAIFGVTGREELLAGLTRLSSPRAARRAVTRRRLVLAVAAVAVVATATAATWVVLRGGPARETTSVQCLIGNSDAIIPSTSGDPTHDCAADYRREFGTTPPPLVAYDNGHGGVTVLPHSQTPPAGWKPLPSQDAALIELQDSLDDYVRGLNASCLDSGAATNLVKAKLAQFGFTGWTVTVENPSSGGSAVPAPAGSQKAPTAENGGNTCWNVDVVDPSSRTVSLLPTGIPSGLPETALEKLAVKLRPIAQRCESLPAAAASVRTAASNLGISESGRGYDLNTVKDNSMRCASVYETVGGTIFVTVRGPGH